MPDSDDELFGAEHVRVYRETEGERGYHWRGTTILLLTTEGRTSGEPRTTPLIHRTDGDRWVVVASKGGADTHPGWYLNVLESNTIGVQIATQAFEATWREPEGEERHQVWAYMAHLYPPYLTYQQSTSRQIPLLMLTTVRPIDVFSAEGSH